jgi:DNA (cytosine-5)-methyltransferase 1
MPDQLPLFPVLEIPAIPVAAVDLYCGGGGLTYGLQAVGLPVVAGIDIDPVCEYVYEANNPGADFVKADLDEYKPEEVAALYPSSVRHRVLVGCAPCQPFSRYTRSQKDKTDNKWSLVKRFGEVAEVVKPTVLSMENVGELAAHEVYEEFVAKLRANDYYVSSSVVYCPDYGIPQQRERLVLFASLLGEIHIVPPTHKPHEYLTVKDAIGEMEELEAGQISENDILHRCSKLSALNMERIKASIAGGTWRDWSEELRADCHKVATGATYPSVYGRMDWNRPAPTMTTQYFGFGNGRFGHPEQDRAISLREGAVLQSFPKEYILAAPDTKITFASIGRMIGNAVPPKLGEAVGRTIIEHLHHYNAI